MPKRYISQLVENEKVCDVFLLADKQLRQNRNGNLYLQMRLGDRSGELTAMLWNATESTGNDVRIGDYVCVEGATQLYNGAMQMIATRVEPADDMSLNAADYVRTSQYDTAELREELAHWLRSVRTPHLQELTECFLSDEKLLDRYARAPAAIKNHHAYVGGLLEHVVSMLRLANTVANHYPQLQRDILLCGVFLHDIGKIDELSYDREFSYTDEGQLLGHLVIGVSILEKMIAEVERISSREFPVQLALQLKHLILTHHGKYEFGSPKLPMTLEAVALHFIDDLDSKMHWLDHLMREDVNTDSLWTPFHAPLGRKLFKGTSTESGRG